VHLVQVENNSKWSVRLSEFAHQKILNEFNTYQEVETGGILLGRISETQQAFIVTDILSAPRDSRRSRTEFELGFDGVRRDLREYSSSCNSSLYCLGTWHSHLHNTGPSQRDFQVAEKIAQNSLFPSILLIKTPNTYRAIIAESSSNQK